MTIHLICDRCGFTQPISTLDVEPDTWFGLVDANGSNYLNLCHECALDAFRWAREDREGNGGEVDE